jgi:hypothetical protein
VLRLESLGCLLEGVPQAGSGRDSDVAGSGNATAQQEQRNAERAGNGGHVLPLANR